MKKRIAIAIAAAMIAASLGACSSQSAQPSSESAAEAAPEQEAAEKTEEAQETVEEVPAEETPSAETPLEETPAAEAATAETSSAEEETADVYPVFSIMSYWLSETDDDYTLIASGSYEIAQLTEEAAIEYAPLNKSLEALREEIVSQREKDYEELEEVSESAYEDMGGNTGDFMAGSMESEIEAFRCDGEVLSFLETTRVYYPGSAHGLLGYKAYNFNTVSGAPIALADVFADPASLVPVVLENLKAQPDGTSVTGTEIEEMMSTAFQEGFDDLDWVLDQDGVTFYFAPSEIAAYAVGSLEAEITFADYPDLFTGKYAPYKGRYVRKISPYAALRADLDGDGNREYISVTGTFEEDGDSYQNSGIKVSVDDQTCEAENWFYNLDAYFVHVADGKNYIYTVTTSDNDYQTVTVFAIKDNVPEKVGDLNGSGTASLYHYLSEEEGYSQIFPMLDPSSFALGSRMNLMSTYSAYRFYEVGSDGMPSPLTDQYAIENEIKLTTRIPLTAEVVDVQTEELTGEEIEIPAGTVCTFWRTNGVDTVDLMLEDESAVRVHVVSEWPQTVNGIDLQEAFDGTVFAG